MRRFYIAPEAISDNLAILPPSESRHATAVLRLQPGTAVELFDGTGQIYQGLIRTADPKRLTVEIISRSSQEKNDAPLLFVFQSLLKGQKMDFLVQKATELGVHAFIPVQTKYIENRGNIARQAERWQRIMMEACKQCRRSRPMRIEPVTRLDDIDAAPFQQRLVLWEGEKAASLDRDMVAGREQTALFIGPEGGFHEDEITLAREKGFRPVSLGSRILRAETAALSGMAIIQFLSGGFELQAEKG